jgi:general secretion pathway protein D
MIRRNDPDAIRTRTMLTLPTFRRALVGALPLVLAACASQQPAPDAQGPGSSMRTTPMKSTTSTQSGMSPQLADAAQRALEPGLPSAEERARIFKGTGVLVKGQQPGGGMPPGQAVQATGNSIVLNFEGADLREVVRSILGDTLNQAYTIDAAVGGTVTLRTTTGIPREALPATLEMLLRMNGAAMVKEDGIFKIVPQAAAVRGNLTPQLGNSQRALPPGFSVQIVPLRYIGVREMARILEPFARDASAVRPDELRNMMILSGTEVELRHLMETIDMFDIDWMAGMSVGVFTLQYADVKSVSAELEKAVGDKATSPLAGILRIIPIERLNALLVITPQPTYLDEFKKWIARLDQAGTGDGPQFFIYNLQNQRAERLAPLLTQAFTGRAAPAGAAPPPTLAPGTPAGQIVNPPQFQAQPTSVVPSPINVTTTPATPPGGAGGAGARAGEGLAVVRNVQVVADKDQNTLMIIATAQEYRIIEAALKKLDVPARQVLIDVTMAEVSLTDELDFGVDWLFKGAAPAGRGSGGNVNGGGGLAPINPAVPIVAAAATAAANPALALAQGFYYLINNANFPGGIQAALHLLDTYGNTKVLANPHLSALDNQKATIKAGNRIPICQQTFVGSGTVGTVNNAVTTTSQYIDTGVLMQVTPHMNQGGLITLDVQVEVSIPAPTTVACDAPAINTRSVQSLVAVQSGQTLVMGGLIQEDRKNTSSGLPLLSRIPVLGGLFGNQKLNNDRTELIVFITPRMIENEIDLKNVIDELRRKMQNIDESLDVFNKTLTPSGRIFPSF